MLPLACLLKCAHQILRVLWHSRHCISVGSYHIAEDCPVRSVKPKPERISRGLARVEHKHLVCFEKSAALDQLPQLMMQREVWS